MEFALILLPFLTMLFGMIQYGLYFYSAQTGSATANEAVRQLSVGNCQDSADLKAFVTGRLGGAATGAPTIATTYLDPGNTIPASPAAQNVLIGGTVKLDLSFPTLNMHFPFVPFLSDSAVSRVVTARVEDTNDEGCGA